MDTNVIIITQLTRYFKETVAVDQLLLEVHAGEIFGFSACLHFNMTQNDEIRHLINRILPHSS